MSGMKIYEMGWQVECNVEWNKWSSKDDVDIFQNMALPPSSSFSHPRQLVLFFRARLLIFSPETRLRGPDTDELLSLLGGTLFSKIFHRVWSLRSSHRGGWLFRCNANRGAADDFAHFVLPCLGGGTYDRSCRKIHSQWIEVTQARACGTARHLSSWNEAELHVRVSVEQFWREQCNARKSSFLRYDYCMLLYVFCMFTVCLLYVYCMFTVSYDEK